MKGTVLFLSCLVLRSSIAVDINPDQSEKNWSAILELWSAFDKLLEAISNRLVDLPEKFSKLEEEAGNTQLEFYSSSHSSIIINN